MLAELCKHGKRRVGSVIVSETVYFPIQRRCFNSYFNVISTMELRADPFWQPQTSPLTRITVAVRVVGCRWRANILMG